MPEQAVTPSPPDVVAWPADAAARYVASGYWEGRSMGSHLAEAARRSPDSVWLVDGPTRLSRRELMARADGAAARMAALGIGAGDRVVVQLPNCWEHVVVTVACFRLGAVPVWALTQHRHHELSGVVAHARAKALVVPGTLKDFDHQAMAHEIVAAVPGAEHVFVAGDDVAPGGLGLRELCAPAEDPGATAALLEEAAPDAAAVATFLLSGGTTGLPKLVARTHDDFAYMIKRAAALCRFGPDTVYLAVLPLGHGFTNAGPGVLGTLLSGGRVVIADSPAPEVAFAAIERERVTATSVVPAVVMRWLAHREENPDADLASLRLVQVGAARLTPEAARRVKPVLGCTLQQVFGMAEGLLCLTRLDDPDEVVHHTQGRPISPDDEIRIVGEDGEPVAPGEPGVLLARGPYTARSYYDSPATDARSFTEDGWYRTGDIVRRGPGGNLVVTGREKDVVNRGGEKINAEEVEAFALRARGVAHAAAVAMPDAELGERVCLFVVPDGTGRVDLADVRAVMLAAGVASFKLPERLFTLPSLPMTPIGKVDKKALRADAVRRIETERVNGHADGEQP
ncbi:(2,3-dihydroxybenzoyl)adenylate synthase [Streptomyces griseocarneus]|uniref:(2,3-dihydroxybenzoyl)adenylate synthase n=1 Tax=Streptomyces griseocarneus TaxID=51201 RepID=UPI00167D3041|nr:AMP-binding protein [Streptomyces griseocarneus]MBZ6472522.1 AMP-binding protein [Streptomyces griseocarneus]GHG45674.1 2,3-dihydroxybenzoate-AMP ligase [Streptomyces griseocarneus]